jgi:hypothetical protein
VRTRSGRDGLLALGVLAALAAGIVVLGAAGTRGTDPYEVRRSSHLTTPHGTKALFDVLHELGYDVRRHHGSLRTVPAEAGTLCILSPPEPLGQEEIRGVVSWVEGGGTLVLTLGGGTLLPIAANTNQGAPIAALAEALSVRAQRQPASERDVRVREALLPSKADRVRFSGGRTLEGPFLGLPSYRPLVTGPYGDMAGMARRGRGLVVAFADDTPFTNRLLRSPLNAQMLLHLLGHVGRPGPILIDERHQGYGSDRESVARLAGALSGAGLGLVLLQAGLAAAVLLLSAGRRFGAPLPPPRARRRSSTEAAAALGGAYRAAGAAALAAETLAAAAKRRAAARLGIPPTLPPEEYVRRARLSRAPGAAVLAAALERAAGVDGDRELAAAARDLGEALEAVGGSKEAG